jgi:enoyl-CoA hydratase/carnithine racemase
MSESLLAGDQLGTPYVTFERRGAIAWCTVDRPDAKNALTPSMYFAIRRSVQLVNSDPDLSGLIITGTGDVFIPGGELKDRDPHSWANVLELFGWDHLPFDALRRSRKPVVSAVNGLAYGGGLLIAMLSDVAVISETARLRVPELLVGVTDVVYAQVLAAHVGVARARDLLFTAREMTAHEAVEWGLVTRTAPKEQVAEEALRVMGIICRMAPQARVGVKRILAERYGDFDRITHEISMESAEFKEGKAAFTERREPAWVPAEFRTP